MLVSISAVATRLAAMTQARTRIASTLRRYGAACLALSLAPGLAFACACGCGLFDVGTSSMFAGHAGGMLFVEDDYMDQNQNWSGTSKAAAANNGDKQIRTQFGSVGGQYQFNRSWGAMVDLPYWDRHFKTTDADTGQIVGFTHGAIGDVRLRGVYTGFSDDMSTGLTFGLKLPTGDSTYANFDPDTEIGTGSTDALLGAYHLGRIGDAGPWAYFAQLQWQQPLRSKSTYRPGAEVVGVVGTYYEGWHWGAGNKFAPLIQLAAGYRDHDSGTLGDPINSGYSRLLITPGAELKLGAVSIYMDVGFPLLVNTSGNQLVASQFWKLNVSDHF
jgi:hypothetical protein